MSDTGSLQLSISGSNRRKICSYRNNILTGATQNKEHMAVFYTWSSSSVSNNPIMVKNVDKCKNKYILTVQTNDGLKYFFHTASLHIFPLWVHYNPDSIATILSFKDVTNIPGASITTDTSKERSVFVTLESKYCKFRWCALELYHYNT